MAKEGNSEPMYLQVSSGIIASIAAGDIVSGDSLPSIRECADRYGTSPATVQRAFQHLESEGYIQSIPGKGAIVTSRHENMAPNSPVWRVFWSYAQKDDALEGGRITSLRMDIEAEYQMQTGNELSIFQDSKDIEWGMDWRKAITENLGATTFFVPVLTPTYLRRPNCLGELKAAIAQFDELGMDEGIYPIEYIDISNQLKSLDDDDVANCLSNRQRLRDWRELRFEDRDSAAYRKGVRDIVLALIAKDEKMKSAFQALQSRVSEGEDSSSDNRPGLLDSLSEIEDQSQALTDCLRDISNSIVGIGGVFGNVNTSDKMTPKEAVILSRKIACQLIPYSSALKAQGMRYRSIIKKLDRGISALVELIGLTQSYENAGQILESMRALRQNADVAFSQIDLLLDALLQIEAMSRELRGPARNIRSAMEDVMASRNFFNGWVDSLEGLVLKDA